MLSAHIYLSSCTFAAHCDTPSHASRHRLCWRWTLEFSPTRCTLHSAFNTPHFRTLILIALYTPHSALLLHVALTLEAIFCVSCPSPCQASFPPLPLALKHHMKPCFGGHIPSHRPCIWQALAIESFKRPSETVVHVAMKWHMTGTLYGFLGTKIDIASVYPGVN